MHTAMRTLATWVQEAEFQMKLLANETRFILAVVSGELAVSNRRRADIIADLEAAGYDRMPPNKKVRGLPCGAAEHACATKRLAPH